MRKTITLQNRFIKAKKNNTVDKNAFKNDNRGFSLAFVLICIGFVGMLSALIMFMTLLNYRIRMADIKNKNSFYSAEHALDEIKAGLETEVSKAVGEAYMSVMENYSTLSGTERTEQFEWKYISCLRKALKVAGNDGKYDIALLSSYLQDTKWDSANSCGALLSSKNAGVVSNDYGTLLVYTDGVVLKNLTVTYRSKDGNISIITTDIKLQLPSMDFSETFKLPDVLSYCMIANDKLDVNSASLILKGSMYGGKDGIYLNNSSMQLDAADMIVTDSLISVNNGSFSLGEGSTLWAQGIDINNSSIWLKGVSYIKDDLTIAGNGSSVTLSNTYYGYGFGETENEGGNTVKVAKNNSAIIINGLNTRLDMSGVTKLFLAGNAFINSAKEDSWDEGYTNKNIVTGESLTAKSGQIAYLVPPECLWVKDGKSLCNSNPITAEQLSAYSATPGAYEVDLSVAESDLKIALNNYSDGYRKVYANINGTKLVYYYLTFPSENNASRFFKAYYEHDKEQMDKYLKVYMADLKVPTESMIRVNLAGNIFTMEDGEFRLIDATSSDDDVAQLQLESRGYETTFNQLCTTLTRIEPTASQAQEKEERGIFYNIIDKNALDIIVDGAGSSMTTTNGTDPQIKRLINISEETSVGAVIVKNLKNEADNHPYVLGKDTAVSSSDWNKIKIIIASGDVVVDINFKGIIISGGTITVTPTGSITADEMEVSKAMQLTQVIGGVEYMIVNLFTDGDYVMGNNTATNGELIETGKLIVYENWRKE